MARLIDGEQGQLDTRRTKALNVLIHSRVVPQCDVILAPVVLDVGVMTLMLHLEEIIQHRPTFIVAQLVNSSCERRIDVDGLQPRHRVGSDHRVRCRESSADVVRRASGLGAKGETLPSGLLLGSDGVVRRGEAREESSVRRGEGVVGVVVRGPEGAATRDGQEVSLSSAT